METLGLFRRSKTGHQQSSVVHKQIYFIDTISWHCEVEGAENTYLHTFTKFVEVKNEIIK